MFDFNGDEMFVNILKPNQIELDTLDVYELTSPIPTKVMLIRQQKTRKRTLDNVHMEELCKRLTLAPIDIIAKTLQNRTQYYISIGHENKMDPRGYLK